MNIINKINRKIINKIAEKRYLSFRGKVQLDKNFNLVPSFLKPRIDPIEGEIFSFMYSLEYKEIPREIVREVIHQWPAISHACAGKAVIRSATIYRNLHVPAKYRHLEIFSDAWHRDTIGVPNVQMFFLLHETTSSHGPLTYIDSLTMPSVIKKYPALLDSKKRSLNFEIPAPFPVEFIGQRGNFCLISTFANFHRATIPHFGHQRDMLSLAFEPAAICTRPRDKVLDYQQIKKLQESREIRFSKN